MPGPAAESRTQIPAGPAPPRRGTPCLCLPRPTPWPLAGAGCAWAGQPTTAASWGNAGQGPLGHRRIAESSAPSPRESNGRNRELLTSPVAISTRDCCWQALPGPGMGRVTRRRDLAQTYHDPASSSGASPAAGNPSPCLLGSPSVALTHYYGCACHLYWLLTGMHPRQTEIRCHSRPFDSIPAPPQASPALEGGAPQQILRPIRHTSGTSGAGQPPLIR